MLCLVVCRLSVEHEWSETTRDRALSFDGGSVWFKWGDQIVALIWDQVVQLGKSGEY
jgi:hypothetical protein